jgi:lysophospholipase
MQLYEIPGNPAPKGAAVYTAHTRNNKRLRAFTAPATIAESRGTVVLLNGRGEFLERYFETMRELQARGFHVAGFDWRGQGGSQRLLKDGLRGHIRSFREYDEDLRAVMEGVITKNCPGPYYAIGHSTGGHILLRSLTRQKWFRKAIVTAPLLGLNYRGWPKSLAFTLAALATSIGLGWLYLPGYKKPPFLLGKFENNPLTTDQKRWNTAKAVLDAHPALGVGGPTFGWLVATMLSFKDTFKRSKSHVLNCPVLMVLAGREQVVDNRESQAYAAQTPGVAVVTIAQSLHEILHENDAVRREFFAAFDSYVADRRSTAR